MIAQWQVNDLVALVRERYPGWEGFEHPPFERETLQPLRQLIAKGKSQLGKGEMKRLLAVGDYAEFVARLEKIGKDGRLLWTGNKARGDLAILYAENLPLWSFCEQMRDLMVGQRPSPDRLDTFAEYCIQHQLPSKWPFATFFMFLARPHAEIFFKPRLAQWFLKFMGLGNIYTPTPSADTYEQIKKNCHGLKAEMGARDMVDIYALLSVAYAESQQRIERLNVEAQVDLDMPRPLREEGVEYSILKQKREAVTIKQPDFSLEDWAAQSGHPFARLESWVAGVERKKQAIFYGPPGTGKTYTAQQLARHLVGGGDGLLEMVQFHPAYDYADFVQGIRPRTVDGNVVYDMVNGRFLDFCLRATDRGRSVLIIDEINRANLSRVFGELMVLLEYREQTVKLASGEAFHIPENVLLIGTMNTADRSIALVDHALRRRFAFFELTPDFELLTHYHQESGYDPKPLIQVLQRINADIQDPHYALGITYFLTPTLAADLETIWRTEIVPYLEEYFFNQPAVVEPYQWERVQTELLA